MSTRQTPEEMEAILRAAMPDARLRKIEDYIATLPTDVPERVEIERRLPEAWRLVEDNKPSQTTARMVELETLQRLVERAAARMWAKENKPDMEAGRRSRQGGAKGGGKSKRRAWAEQAAEQVRCWEDLPDPESPLELDDWIVYRDGDRLVAVDQYNEKESEIARSTFEKRYLNLK